MNKADLVSLKWICENVYLNWNSVLLLALETFQIMANSGIHIPQVAFLGPKGSYTHQVCRYQQNGSIEYIKILQAALEAFGEGAVYSPCSTISSEDPLSISNEPKLMKL